MQQSPDILKGVYNKKLRQEEKDSSLIAYVEWKKDEIKNLLDKRVEFLVKRAYTSEGVKFGNLFDFNVLGKLATDYILERTMMRPRDAIEFVNICLRNVSGESANLNEDIVLEAEESFYAERKVALCSEWYSLYPNLRQFLDALSVFLDSDINLQNLIEKKDIICEILLQADDLEDEIIKKCVNGDLTDLLNVWFICGVIGRKKSETLIIYSNHKKPDLDITDYNKEFKIHPLFFRN